jgi:hypothetical protein
MKTSIKLRIGFCILLSVLLLVMIGRKSRENFEGSGASASSENLYNQSGYPINNSSNPNHIEEKSEQAEPSEQNKLCALASRTDAERETDIKKDVAEARQQLLQHLKQKVEAQKAKEEKAKLSPFYDPKGADCSLLRFPAII